MYKVYVKLKDNKEYRDTYYNRMGYSQDYMVEYIQKDINLIYPDNLGIKITKH